MMYRTKIRSSIFSLDEVLVQERRWYGWRTIRRFFSDFDGLQRAREFITAYQEHKELMSAKEGK